MASTRMLGSNHPNQPVGPPVQDRTIASYCPSNRSRANPRRPKALIGVAMVGLGLVQARLYATRSAWMASILGLLYTVIGLGYLWAEVSAVDT